MDTIQEDDRIVRRNAAFVGVAFIVASAAGIVAAAIASPLLEAPSYLGRMVANERTVRLVAFLVFVMSIACAGVGLGLYSILRRLSVGMSYWIC